MRTETGAPRSLSEIARLAFDIYRRHFNELFPIAVFAVPGVLLSALLSSDVGTSGADLALAWVYSLPLLVSTWFVNAALVAAVGDIVEGRAPDLARAYRRALGRGHRLLGAALIEALALVGLTVTLIGFPVALYFAVRWAFVQQRIVLRDDAVFTAFSESGRTTGGAWWRTFGALLALAAVSAAPVFVIGGAVRAVSLVTGEALAAIMTAAAQPFTAAAITLLYLDLESRKESHERLA
ncbi:MAG TPA: hypothetical protein VNM43_10690 [Dehalococcoidia bacterium]|nr:hypothetical protein [Dehalococcoidia bacterium]